MKTIQSVLWLCVMHSLGCGSEINSDDHGKTIEFRGGLMVEENEQVSIDRDLLDERDGYKTTLTDSTGHLWEIGSADGLDTTDFATAKFMEGQTGNNSFYHRLTMTEAKTPDCAVYIHAGSDHYIALRRGTDQGDCPTTEEYRTWLPNASLKDASEAFGTVDGALSFGTKTGSFNGVDSFSNSSPGYYCPDFKPYSKCQSYVGSQVAGIMWQCVEYADRYFLSVFKHTSLWKGHAKYWYDNATQHGLKKFPNCGTTAPKVGDMLASNYGSFGHIAIVRAVGASSVSVIQQNWFENEKDNNHTLKMTTAGGKFCVSGFGASSYPVVGWIRK